MRYICVLLEEEAIVKTTIFLYNTLMIRILTLLTALLGLAAPVTAYAYLEPEEVLLNSELFLPPAARAAQERTDIQSQESAARREREQERAFALQHPVEEEVVVEEEPEPLFGSAPNMLPPGAFYAYPVPMQGNGYYGQPMFLNAQPNLDNANLELARTMRLLTRVNQNQAAAELNQVLHSSAGGLAPTGAGTVLGALTLMGATIWTLRRARNAKAMLVN